MSRAFMASSDTAVMAVAPEVDGSPEGVAAWHASFNARLAAREHNRDTCIPESE